MDKTKKIVGIFPSKNSDELLCTKDLYFNFQKVELLRIHKCFYLCEVSTPQGRLTLPIHRLSNKPIVVDLAC